MPLRFPVLSAAVLSLVLGVLSPLGADEPEPAGRWAAADSTGRPSIRDAFGETSGADDSLFSAPVVVTPAAGQPAVEQPAIEQPAVEPTRGKLPKADPADRSLPNSSFGTNPDTARPPAATETADGGNSAFGTKPAALGKPVFESASGNTTAGEDHPFTTFELTGDETPVESKSTFSPKSTFESLPAPGSDSAPLAGPAAEPAPTPELTVAAAVREGIELERGRRWLDAVKFYTDAHERFPEDTYLEYGLRRAKFQFNIERRYSDGSFESTLLTKAPSAAYALFDEIFAQVRSHYVETVSVTSFTAHGTESLYLALANDKFLRRHIPNADPASVGRLRQTLREQYWNRNCEGTGRSRATIQEVCGLARGVGLGETPVILEYVFGGCNALDDYSNYLTPDRLSDLFGNIDGEFVGLGIEMEAVAGEGMLLVNVLPDSPAAAGGMKASERIVSIDGVDCRNMSTDEAARMLKGLTGSTVILEVAAAEGTVRRGRFTRAPVVVHSVEAVQMLDRANGIGYLRLTGFQKTTPAEMDAALSTLRAQGLRKLIWDVRGNPGGLLTAAVEVLDRFIPEGTLVSTKGRNFDQNWTYSAHRTGTLTDIEIVLLIDDNSASASEIVAGAIRDHKRGTLVGRKSYGKWSVQSIMQMNERTGLRLTTAKFYAPSGNTYGHIGLKPDIEVAAGARRTAFRHNDVTGLMSDADVRAAVDVFTGSALTSR